MLYALKQLKGVIFLFTRPSNFPDSMPTWAHAGQMMGPRCPAGPRPGPCWVFPGVPTYCHVGICWASPAGAQLGMPSICPQWAISGHAQLGPNWACATWPELGMPSRGPVGLAQDMPTMGTHGHVLPLLLTDEAILLRMG